MKLPPLGLRPRWLVAELRLTEIAAAVARYQAAGQGIPTEWEQERDELVRYLSERVSLR